MTIAPDVDARVARGTRVVADEPDLVARRGSARARNHTRHAHAMAMRKPRWTVRPREVGDDLREVGEPGQPGLARELLGELEAALAPGSEDPEADPLDGDVVEHQGGDDLVDAEARLEPAGDATPQRARAATPATIITGHDHERRRARRQERHQHHRRRAPRAQEQLALGADVPEPHPEGERAGEAREDERRRLDERVREHAEAAERRRRRCGANDQERVAADERDEQRPRCSSATTQSDGEGRDGQPARRLEPALGAGSPTGSQ